MARTSVCVVGSGVVGLTAALFLSKRGHEVVVMAREMPGDESKKWASPWAGAILAPHPDYDKDLQVESLKHWKATPEDRSSGLKSILIEEYYDDRDDTSKIWYRNYFEDFEFIDQKSLPPKARLGYRYTGQVVEPALFLRWLIQQLKDRGVSFIKQEVQSLEVAKAQSGAELVVNAAGQGAGKLAADDTVVPVRGQTLLLRGSQDRVKILQGSEYTYVIPRPYSQTFVVGGVREPAAQSEDADPAIRTDILRRVERMTGMSLSEPEINDRIVRDIVAFRPGRQGGLKLEREGWKVHAYGADGLGYLHCFGIASSVCKLVDEYEPKAKL